MLRNLYFFCPFIFAAISGCATATALPVHEAKTNPPAEARLHVVETVPGIRVVRPEPGDVYSAGATVDVVIKVDNFKLRRPMSHGDHHAHSQAGDHSGDHTKQFPDEGHYHIYLNDDAGSDPHTTAWEPASSYELPQDLPPGSHTIRIELRDNHHAPLGIEATVSIQVR